jgi:2-iminobutanoate/2-iminopropanoate deaminase
MIYAATALERYIMSEHGMTRIDPNGFTRAPHFSQAVRIDAPAKVVYVAGQVAGDGFGTVACDGFEAQIHAVFDRVATILEASGMNLTDLVKINGYITDRRNVPIWRQVVLERLGNIRPASTLVITELTDPRLLVEIDAVAAQGLE